MRGRGASLRGAGDKASSALDVATANQGLSFCARGPVALLVGLLVLGTILGFRMGRRVHSPSTGAIAKRIGIFWLLLVIYGIAAIAVARPTDGKQATMLIVLFIMIGYLAMSLLFSFASVWWPLPITALALIGYFLLPDYFYLWMSILGGGGMIVLGLYIHSRW